MRAKWTAELPAAAGWLRWAGHRAEWAADGPRGVGDPVVVLPGFGTTDRATWPLRWHLSRVGHQARGWGLGRNHGRLSALMPAVCSLVERLGGGKPVALVGWSLGGVVAREVARARPELVSRIATLGSPVVGGPTHTAVAPSYEKRGVDLRAISERRHAEALASPVRCPVLVLFSRRDAVVDWRAAIDPYGGPRRHREVQQSHFGMAVDRQALRWVCEFLATPADALVNGWSEPPPLGGFSGP